MQLRIAQIALMVREYDEAIRFYVDSLGFELRADRDLGGGKRWVRVGPVSGGVELLLSRATTAEQASRVGNQTGNKVFLLIETDDFFRDYATWRAKGVTFTEKPRHEPYGTVAVCLDLYGNKIDLIEPK